VGDLKWDLIRADQLSDFRRLLDHAFGLKAPASYLADFPVWDPSIDRQPNRFQIGGTLEGKLVTTASLRLVEYALAEGRVEKIGLIGAVATHPDHGGKGYASASLDRIFVEGRNHGVKAFALWGSESALYSKRGFRFGGTQLRTPLERLAIEGEIPEGYEVRTGWDEEVFNFLSRRKTGVRYLDSDLLWLSRQKSVEWRTIWFEGKCLAYCGWNRGIDLPGIIHEIDGTEEGKRALLLFVKRRYPELELLHHPRDTAYGLRAISLTEKLAQFKFEAEGSALESSIDSVWFSGMDSC